jgi:hypothetical protein
VEVEAVVLLGLEDMVCSATVNGCMCVVRRLAASMGQRRKTVQASTMMCWLWYVCVLLYGGLVSFNMRHLLLILIYAGTLLMFQAFKLFFKKGY